MKLLSIVFFFPTETLLNADKSTLRQALFSLKRIFQVIVHLPQIVTNQLLKHFRPLYCVQLRLTKAAVIVIVETISTFTTSSITL